MEVQFLLAMAAIAHGQFTAADVHARHLLLAAEETCDQRLVGIALYAMAAVNHQQGHAAYAIDLAQRSIEALRPNGATAELSRSYYILGEAYFVKGALNDAREHLETALSLAKLNSEALLIGMASRSLAICHLKHGSFEEAAHAYDRAVKAYEELGAERRIAQTRYGRAVLAVTSGDLTYGRELLNELAADYCKDENSLAYARWRVLAGWLCNLEGDSEHAVSELSKARGILAQADAQRDTALCSEFLGDAHALRGQLEAALIHYEEGAELGRMVSEFSDVAIECMRKRAEVLVRQGRVGEAVTEIRKARMLTTRCEDRLEIASILRVRGLIKLAHGRRTCGMKFLQEAWGQFERMGAEMEARVTAQLIAKLLGDDRRTHEAAVWRNLGGTRRLPTLDLYLSRRSSKHADLPPRSIALDDLTAQAAAQGIITRDPRILKAFELTVRGAPSHLPLLIFGETGTGKELLAAVAHQSSGRTGAFIPINCAALPPDLLDAELFGHARGAYTGALRDRPGLIEAAAGGTLFLDEIGEMTLPVQGRLLRAIELGEIRRIGENRPRQVNTRFVGATHRDLQEMVRQGGYRADLFFRLRGIVVTLAPLRERPWDVDLLIDHFLGLEAAGSGRELRLSSAARDRLRAHPWPGNVRELRSLVERLVAMHPKGTLVEVEDLGLDAVRVSGSLEEHLEDEERRRLIATLESVGWNRSRAARLLKLKRTTLLGKLRRLGIAFPTKR